jgi:hypothetical protein
MLERQKGSTLKSLSHETLSIFKHLGEGVKPCAFWFPSGEDGD